MSHTRTFIMLKPDALERGLQNEIVQRIVDAGLRVDARPASTLDAELVDAHYAEHLGKAFYPDLQAFTLSGPTIRAVVYGNDAVTRVRALIGATDPAKAAPGTIRGELNDGSGIVRRNLIHASDSPEAAERELALHGFEQAQPDRQNDDLHVHYLHDECPVEPGVTWQETNAAPYGACNSQCPACGIKDIEPVRWHDATEDC